MRKQEIEVVMLTAGKKPESSAVKSISSDL